MMSKYRYKRNEEMKEYVRNYWTVKCDSLVNMSYLMIPAYTIDLIFHFVMDSNPHGNMENLILRDIYISSINNKLYTINLGHHFYLFGLQFNPGYANLFLEHQLSEISGFQKLELLMPDFCNNIYEKLQFRSSESEKISAIEEEIIKIIAKNQKKYSYKDLDISFIISELENKGIDNVCDSYGIHLRKLERLFNTHIGISPKQFQRISRMQKAIIDIITNHDDKLTDIALNSGYYDQSHFNREFLSFYANSPSNFLKQLKKTQNRDKEILKSAIDIFS